MKRLAIIAAVVLICQAAQVPLEQQQSVKASNGSSGSAIKTEIPAPVVQVVKGQIPVTEAPKKAMPGVQNVEKAVIPAVMEAMRTTRAVDTIMPVEMKTVKPTVADVAGKMDTKVVVTSTMQPVVKVNGPSAIEMKRKTRAAMTTMQPEVKMVTLQPEVPQVDKKTATMATMQPVMKRRQTRAAPFVDNDSKKGNQHMRNHNADTLKAIWSPKERAAANKMLMHRSMRSIKDEVTTIVPVAVEQVVVGKSSVMSTTKSTIDPCDLLCTKFEFDPICASNGLCLHEFPNQCILDTFNCKHPKGKFTATRDDSCQMSWLTKCEESDMI